MKLPEEPHIFCRRNDRHVIVRKVRSVACNNAFRFDLHGRKSLDRIFKILMREINGKAQNCFI